MMPTMTSAETELNFSGTQASISKITSGQLSLSTLSLYKGSDKNAALPIVSVTQNESTFNVVLESDTELPLTIGYSFNAFCNKILSLSGFIGHYKIPTIFFITIKFLDCRKLNLNFLLHSGLHGPAP